MQEKSARKFCDLSLISAPPITTGVFYRRSRRADDATIAPPISAF